MNKSFYCLELEIKTEQCCHIPLHSISIMGRFTPDCAFQSALLHSSIPNTSKLSTPVIGSYKTWYYPQELWTNTGQQCHLFLASFWPNFQHINSSVSKESGDSESSTGIDNIEPIVSIGIAITFGLLTSKSDRRCTWLLKYSIL